MIVVIIAGAAAWIVFSTILAVMACMNSSRLSQQGGPHEQPIKKDK